MEYIKYLLGQIIEEFIKWRNVGSSKSGMHGSVPYVQFCAGQNESPGDIFARLAFLQDTGTARGQARYHMPRL